MEWLWEQVEEVFRKSGEDYTLWSKGNYVDDARAWVTSFRKGTVFKDGRLTWTEEQEAREEEGTSREGLTLREMKKVLN